MDQVDADEDRDGHAEDAHRRHRNVLQDAVALDVGKRRQHDPKQHHRDREEEQHEPVANRVEVPCLGRNVLGATNALACANMALADFDPVIPLDEVIETMDRVGKAMPSTLCCTALGGLSITKTSKDIEQKLNK